MNSEYSLWMGDIEPWMNESFIMNSFIEYGFRPKNIKLVRDKRFNKLNNYCFVNKYFKLNIAKFNYKFSKNLYVGNLSPKINDIDLFNIFKSKYPSVYYASIITDNGISRGYGFVHFGNEDEYKKSLKEMNGIFIDNRIIRVKEKNCEEKKDKYQFNNNINFNCIKNNYLMEKIEEEKYSLDNEETNCSLVEREQELSLSDTSNSNNKSFINNLKLLESDDIITLNNKIQEKIDNLYNYEKTIKNNNNISKILLYYRSN